MLREGSILAVLTVKSAWSFAYWLGGDYDSQPKILIIAVANQRGRCRRLQDQQDENDFSVLIREAVKKTCG